MQPQTDLFQMATGFVASQAIYAAAHFNIAEHLAHGPSSIDALAAKTGAHAGSLHRVLRALASVGVFTETTPRTFANTPMSELLRPGVANSQYAGVLMIGRHCYPAFGEIVHSVETGRPGFDKHFGAPLFDYLSKRPDDGHVFDQAMQSIHGPETPAMIAAYDFKQFNTIVDIGGGNGSTLLEILKSAPRARGVVFDLPGVVERTAPLIGAAGLADRCRAEAGSFFESVTKRADAYILRHIIHDWDDDKSVQILTRCREAAAPGARILIVESVIPEGNEPHPGKWLDIIMLAVPAGFERTESAYQSLTKAAGLKLTRIVPTKSPVSVIEAMPA